MESTDRKGDTSTKKYALTMLIIALTLVTLILILIYALVPREEQSMHAQPEIPQEEPPAQMQAHPETAQTKQAEKAENPNRIITQAQEAQAEIKEVQPENLSNTHPQEPPAQPESPNNTQPQEAQPNNNHTGTRPRTPLLQECMAHYENKIVQLEEEIEVLKEKTRKQGRAYALLMDNMQENVVDIARLRVDMTESNNELRSHVQRHDESIKELKTQ
ncbi:hypothetical protein NEAUS03_2345, partial [Nematocida ausubeli]